MDAGYYSSEINIIRDACSLNDICGWYRQGQILWESGNTVETVVGLHRKDIQKSLNLRTLQSFFSFNRIAENHKEKELVRKVTVVVALDLGCGNTKNSEYESKQRTIRYVDRTQGYLKKCPYFVLSNQRIWYDQLLQET